jgi:hypothetical protein
MQSLQYLVIDVTSNCDPFGPSGYRFQCVHSSNPSQSLSVTLPVSSWQEHILFFRLRLLPLVVPLPCRGLLCRPASV